MNVIRYKEKEISLEVANQYCKQGENIVLLEGDSDGTVVMNQKLLEKIALSSFLSEGLEDVTEGRVLEGNGFFDNLEGKLNNGSI